MFAAAFVLGILLALIHESLVVMFAPVMLFAMLCRVIADARAGTMTRTPYLPMAAACAIALSAFIASTVVGMLGTKSPETIHALQASVQRHANFPLRG